MSYCSIGDKISRGDQMRRTISPARAALAKLPSLLLASAISVMLSSGVSAASPRAMVRDPGLSTVVTNSGATYLGVAEPAASLRFDVLLAPGAPSSLQKFVDEVSTPGSDLYHDFLTRSEFDSRFGPRKAVVAEATAWLGHDGFRVTRRSAFVLSVQGTAGDVRSLGLAVGRYRGASGPEGLMATGVPLVPADLAGGQVTGIVGLNSLAPVRYLGARPVALKGRHLSAPTGNRLDERAMDGPSPAPVCTAGAQAAQTAGAYTISELSSYYDLDGIEPAGQYGEGVTVALPEVDPVSLSDVEAYESCLGLNVDSSVVDIDNGATGSFQGEADLDFEEVATLAPGAAIDVYEGPDTLPGVLDMMSAIVSADKAQVISLSLDVCEGPGNDNVAASNVVAMGTVLEQAAAQGQSVLAASGDAGSEGCFSGSSPLTSLSVDYPASNPLVTAVGGTVITGNGELAWNDCNGTGTISCAQQIAASGGVGATGGGVSTLYAQRPTGQPVLNGTTGYREVPDVSAESGSNFGDFVEFYIDGKWQPYLGTSLATPIWASLVADRDSACATATGDFNPALYSLYSAGNYGVAFNQVTEGYMSAPGFSAEAGTDDYTQTNGGSYPLTPGYNMVSGIGSPIATGLACSEVVGAYSGHQGQQVTLSGVGLEDAAINFGPVAAAVVSESATEATVVVPAGQGTVAISASSPVLGTSTQEAEFTFAPGGGGNVASPVTSTTQAAASTTGPTTTTSQPGHRLSHGYWLVGEHGKVYAFGSGGTVASPHVASSETITGSAATPDDDGYWLVGADGRTYRAGDARSYGDIPALGIAPAGSKTARRLAAPIVGILPSPDAKGYLLVGSDGGLFAFGDARSLGSCADNGHCAGPVVAAVPSPLTDGYWLVTASGHVYAFGRVRSLGQCTSLVSSSRSSAVAAAPTSDGLGLWVLLADGAVCHLGDAADYPQVPGTAPSVKKASAAEFGSAAAIIGVYGAKGYWVVTTTGLVLRFGDAPNLGDPYAQHRQVQLVTAAGW